MFDQIKCAIALPLPDNQGELAGRNWRENEFQTKDFECFMEEYCIREDGALWNQSYTWETSRKGRPCRKAADWVPMSHYTGGISFYDFIYGRSCDYWVEWGAVFVAGSLTELKLHRWEERDNKDRLASEAEWKAQCEEQERFLSTFIGRRLYPVYAWMVHGCFGMPLHRCCNWCGDLCNRVSLVVMRLGGKLAPYGDPVRAKRRDRVLAALFEEEDETSG